jgi:hypothetical protein
MRYPKVKTGDPIRPQASFVNALADLLANDRQRGVGSTLSPAGRDFYTPVIVKNTDAAYMPAGGVGRVTDSLIDPSENLGRFQGRPVLAVEVATSDNADSTAVIATDRIEADGFGLAAIAGVIQCRVNVSDADHRFAKPSTSTDWELESDASDGFPIVYKESGTGEVWAILEVREVIESSGSGNVFAAVIQSSTASGTSYEFEYTIRAVDTFTDEPSSWTTTGPDLTAYNVAERVEFGNFTPTAVSDGVGVLAIEVDTDVYAFSLAPIEGECT